MLVLNRYQQMQPNFLKIQPYAQRHTTVPVIVYKHRGVLEFWGAYDNKDRLFIVLERRFVMGLVGLPEVKTFVEDIVKKAEVYRYGGVKPPHMIISLAAGNGQSVVTDYITDTFYENKVRRFRSFDKSLEYRVDGTFADAEQIIEDIRGRAV